MQDIELRQNADMSIDAFGEILDYNQEPKNSFMCRFKLLFSPRGLMGNVYVKFMVIDYDNGHTLLCYEYDQGKMLKISEDYLDYRNKRLVPLAINDGVSVKLIAALKNQIVFLENGNDEIIPLKHYVGSFANNKGEKLIFFAQNDFEAFRTLCDFYPGKEGYQLERISLI